MHSSVKTLTRHLLLSTMMVAPAAVNTNLNAATISFSDGITQHEVHSSSSAWVTYAGLHHNADALVNAIAASTEHGLNPNAYDLQSLEQELENYVTKSELSNGVSTDSLARQLVSLEKRLNETFAKFASDLGSGVLDARKTQKNLFRAAPEVDTAELLHRVQRGDATIREVLSELHPSSPSYTKMISHMRTLLDERDSGVVRTKVRHFEDATLGGEHPSLMDIRTRLQETGDLAQGAPLNIKFDRDVEQALKAVQGRHGLEETGEINEDTVIALNATVDMDIEQIAMNLERWRWMPRDMGDRHIMINVPAYQLSMINEETKIVDMPVVVGSKKHNTPIFSKDAEFVEVAPTWTVPASITNNELIPLERENPGYLERERFDFFSWTGSKLVKVDRSSVTAEDFNKPIFPYVLQQRAGADNALGGIKILMPNKHAIYMHDTQAKSLFDKTDRAYSHGCIRLSEPFHLGGLLLQLDGKSPIDTKKLLAKKKTTRVRLKNKVPTHITYFTAWIDDDGKLNTRKDIYNNNKRLLAGLHKSKTLLSTLKERPATILAEQADL